MKLRNAVISLILTLGVCTGGWAGSPKVPASEHVKYMFSAGDKRDYSEVIQTNHQRFAYHRGIEYRFYDLGEQDSPIMKTLGTKQKYWAKIVILQRAMEDKNIPNGSWLGWIDDDIVINDVNGKRSMMDRIIDKYGKGKSVLVANEEYGPAYLNTGIMLVRKGKSGQNVLNKLMEKSKQIKFGYKSQAEHSFHEQGALREIYLGKNGKLETTSFGKPFKEYVGIVPQRDGDMNFNNFRRKSHRDDARNMDLVYNDSDTTKAVDSDAFIHHTGMAMTLRGDMIRETLKTVDEQTELFLNSTPNPGFINIVFQSKQSQGEKGNIKTNQREDTPANSFVLSKRSPTEEQPEEERAKNRKERKAAAKIQLEQAKIKQEEARLKANAFVLVDSTPTEEQLSQEQTQSRKEKKTAAKAKIKQAKDKKRKAEAEEQAKIARVEAEAEIRRQAEAEAAAEAEQQRFYNTLMTVKLKEDAEASLLGLQSLSSATSMMMLTTLTGLTSVMSSYRSGKAFAFGMASIDDIPTSEMMASTVPSARSPVINREMGSWHNFVQLHMMKGNRNDGNGMAGGSINGQGLSAGVFYQLSPEMVAGMMMSMNKNSMSFNQGGNGKVTSVSAGPFISYSLDNWHIDAALSVSHDNYELKRQGITGSELKSEFSGTSLTTYLGTGYDIHLDHWTQGLTLTPMAELMLIHSRHGEYNEKGSSKEALQVKSASNRQLISRLGFEVGYLFPNLEKPTEIKTRFGVQHQNMSAQNTLYQLPTGTAGQVRVPAMSERSWFTGLGIQRQIGEHSKIALNYNGTHSGNGNSHGFQIEFEKKF